MKNIYEVPELEISLFLQSDIMTTSENFVEDPWANMEVVNGDLHYEGLEKIGQIKHDAQHAAEGHHIPLGRKQLHELEHCALFFFAGDGVVGIDAAAASSGTAHSHHFCFASSRCCCSHISA